MTNLELLREKIEDSGVSVAKISEKCGIHRATFHNRMIGKYEFTAKEITVITYLCHLTRDERDKIFFGDNI